MRGLVYVAALIMLAACGGSSGGSTPTPTQPSTPAQPQANRNPTINSISVNPTFGIATFTTYTFASSASDADGDTLTYTWDLAGNSRTGASQTIVFSNGGNGVGTLTVTDGRGGSASQSVQFVSGTAGGSWTGDLPLAEGPRPLTATLSQSSTTGAVTGTWNLPARGVVGNLDPASPNAIDATGRVVLRFKVTSGGTFNDFTFTGQLSTSGRTITGSVSGSGFAGQAVTFNK